MLTALIGGAVGIGAAGISAWVTWIFTRKETQGDLYVRLATSATERMNIAENRIDTMERQWAELRQELYPHRAWDEQVYRKALESDPSYPPPPPLTI